MKYSIIEAEIIKWLDSYEGEKFHAILSDPPYALISIAKRFGPGQVEAQEGADGRFSRLGKGFMGQTWDGFDSLEDYQKWVAEWAKLMIEKVLYPGAVCLFFGGTRTWHHLAVGLENGGFEIYETFMWLHSSGFPKSLSISKSIDKMAGAEREIIEERTINTNYFATSGSGQEQEHHRKKDGAANITIPTTHAAKLWDGYGTAIKPAYEPILMCRAPRKGQTFASLALEFGSGALNIDNSRISQSIPENVYASDIPSASPETQASADFYSLSLESCLDSLRNILLSLGSDSISDKDPLHGISEKGDNRPFDCLSDQIILSHLYPNGIWCGLNLSIALDSLVDCPVFYHFYDGLLRRVQEAAPKGAPSLIYALEHIYRLLQESSHSLCSSNAPLSSVDGLALISSLCSLLSSYPIQLYSKHRPAQLGRWPSNFLLSHAEDCQLLGDIITEGRVINRWTEGMKPFGDAAGEEFESEQLPPETIERWACVAECPVRQLDDQAGIRSSGSGCVIRKTAKGHKGTVYGTRSQPEGTKQVTYGDTGHVSRFFYCGKSSRSEKDAGLETFFWKRVDTGYLRISEDEWMKLEKKQRAKGCIHPTVKPLELLQYLATLLLPPEIEDRERRIFIPFSGSGSEIIGSLKAGWDLAVGLEAEAQYNEIAVARVKHNLGMFLVEAKEDDHGEDQAEEDNVEVGGEDSPL